MIAANKIVPLTEDYGQLPHSSSTTNIENSPISAKKRSKAAIRADFLRDIAQAHEDLFDRQLPRMIAREILQEMEEDGDKLVHDAYMYAIRQAICAPRPSWRYVEVIVDRVKREGVPTRHNRQHRQQKTVTEQRYSQRVYEDDSNRLPDWMARELGIDYSKPQ